MVFHEIKLLLQIKYAKLHFRMYVALKKLEITIAPSLEGPIRLLKISDTRCNDKIPPYLIFYKQVVTAVFLQNLIS